MSRNHTGGTELIPMPCLAQLSWTAGPLAMTLQTRIAPAGIVTVSVREEGFTMKYRLSPREIPSVELKGFPEG